MTISIIFNVFIKMNWRNLNDKMKNKVKKDNEFEYEEEVNEFTGLIFHCPKCDEIFHLHIANVKVRKEEQNETRRINKKSL